MAWWYLVLSVKPCSLVCLSEQKGKSLKKIIFQYVKSKQLSIMGFSSLLLKKLSNKHIHVFVACYTMLYKVFTAALTSSTSADTSWWIISAFLLNSGSRKTPIKDCEPNSHRQLLQIQFNTSGICFDSVLPTNMLSPKWTDIYTVYFQITTNKDQVVGGVSRWRTVCLKACFWAECKHFHTNIWIVIKIH